MKLFPMRRSMASSPASTSQAQPPTAGASNDQIEQPRVKKISLEEAQQFRKEVLDPQFSEANEEMAVFISENSVTNNEDHVTSYQGIVEYNLTLFKALVSILHK